MDSPESPDPNLARLHDDLQAEYTKLLDVVNGFDQRLMTIKGWGVTLSLASIGLGFQQEHFGFFLVAALSGFAFWLLEAFNKMHQMQYYPRMRDIEVIAHELFSVKADGRWVSSPLIDWGWTTAESRIRRGDSKGDPDLPEPWPKLQRDHPKQPWLYFHVMFPHLVSIVVGMILFALGLMGVFGSI